MFLNIFINKGVYIKIMTYKDNLSLVKDKIQRACKKSGRETSEIRLLAVTKKRLVREINEVLSLGINLIGESQLQEALDKLPNMLNSERHFIGHVQSNKVKGVVKNFDVIQSIDSLSIASKINEVAKELGKLQEVYFQVNIGEEDSKYGVLYEEAVSFYDKLLSFINLKVTGIMCIAPYEENPREYFRKMKELFDILPVKNLSMGMTNDFEIAIEEGSNLIRIGRGLFE